MQVMPATARYLAARADLVPAGQRPARAGDLIRFGQADLEHLLQRPPIGDNLIYLAAAYNAGPAGSSAGGRRSASRTTRCCSWSDPAARAAGVRQEGLTNRWSYRARFGQPQPSLEALADRWPTYRALDRDARCMPGIDPGRAFRPLNIAVLTVSDSRSLATTARATCWSSG